VNAFVTTGFGVVHALISDSSFNTSVRKYDFATDALSILVTGNGFVHADLAYDGNFQLFVADRTAGSSGLRVYDTASGAQLTSQALFTGLSPFMIVMPSSGSLSSVPDGLTFGSLQLGAPFPNPCNPRAEITVVGSPNSVAKISVFDLRGRRLLGQQVSLNGDGQLTWTFTGIDNLGRTLPAGVYRIVAENGTGLAARSITLVK